MEITEASYRNINYCLRCGGKMKLQADRENKLRAQCTRCDWTYYKNPIPAVACVILNQNNEVVIIKRLFEPNPGEWALPSGYIEINQSPEKAAEEEMKEETSLNGKVIDFLGYYDGYSPIYEKVLSLGFLMSIEGGELEAGDDAGDAKFVNINKLPKLAFLAHEHFIKIVKDKYLSVK